MTEKVSLAASMRAETNGKAKQILAHGFVPACVYGPGMENKNIKIKMQDFNHAFAIAGESHLIELVIDGKETIRTIIKDVQRDVEKGWPLHVDFYRVSMDKKIETELPLHLVGESKAVKEQGGMLNKVKDAVKIECLPGDLVDFLEIDIATLAEIDDAVRIKDLKAPKGIEFLDDAEEVLVNVLAPRAAAEEEAVAPAEGAEAPAGGEKKE